MTASPTLTVVRPVSEALRLVPAHAQVVATPCCATPTTLLAGLAARSREVPGLELRAGLLFGDASYAEDVLAGRLRYRSWQLSASGRRLADAGAADYVPARSRDVLAAVRRGAHAALVRVTPPDPHGWCSLGPSASYGRELLENAALRIAEIDPTLPRTLGEDVTVPYAAFDAVVDSADAAPALAPSPASSLTDEIGRQVVHLLADGCTLQLGIGAVPDAVARALAVADIGDLRLVGALSDAVVPAFTAGRFRTGAGAVRAVELLGSAPVFDLAHENRVIEMTSSATVHDPRWLAGHDRLVSVCSALAVDLSGQVASEQVAGRVVSGIGGAADFFDGAGLSAGGLRIVALPSRTLSGRSRISPALDATTAVTLPRHNVDLVITEHGVADLRGRSLAERAEALVALAHPEDRDRLRS